MNWTVGHLLAIVALIFEVVHFATAHDTGLPFIALVLVTVAILLSGFSLGTIAARR